jgi:hypothetical protein
MASHGGSFVSLQMSRLGQMAESGTLAPRHGRRIAVGAGVAVFGTVGVGLGTWGSARSDADGWRALVHPILAARGTLLAPLSLNETPASLMRGDSLTAVVQATGRRRIHVAWRATGHAWRDTTLTVRDGKASMALGAIDAPVTLVATDGRSTSDSLAVVVRERPFAGDVAVRAVYPSYLGRTPEVLAPDDVLRLPEGTSLEVMARSAGLANVLLAGDKDTVALTLGAGRARGNLTARSSGTWKWISNVTGADLPPALVLDVVPDSAPRVEIVSPTHDTLVTPGDAVRLVLAAIDDHGLKDVQLHVWTERGNGARDDDKRLQMNDVSSDRWLGELDLDLTNRALKPGDAVMLVAEARDAAPWGRVGTSKRLELKVPTADARREAALNAADSAVARAAAVAAAQKGLEKRTQDAARTSAAKADPSKATQQGAAKDGAASFEAQERARELTADQRALADKVQELSKQADQLSKELQKAGVMDSAISAELREAQRLLQEAMTPELQKQLRDLEANRQKMSGDEMQDALNKLQQPQQNVRDALEKAHEMLKRAALEGAMQSLSDQAKELAQQQKQFADSAAKKPQDAQSLADRAKNVQDEAQKLAERLQKEQATAAKEDAQKAAAEAKESAQKMQEAMKNAMDELGKQGGAGQQGGGQQSGQQGQQAGQQKPGGQQAGQQPGQQAAQQAADAMQKAGESMSDARQAQVDAWKQEITAALDRSIQETLQMARQQEQIGNEAKNGGATGQVKAQQGALQQGVNQTADRLAQQGQKSALISPSSQRAMDAAKQAVEQATKDLDNTTGSQAQQSMQGAADALRQASASLARDRERAGNSQSASGLPEMMKQMQEMAKQQGQLAGEAASLLPSIQQMAQGAAQQEALKQLAQKQRQVAQKLEDAADADPTGRADALAREARQLAQQLDRGALDPSVIDRQQRLFRHMLDAGRTLEQDERDDSGKREARSGQGINSNAPVTGTSSGAAAVKFKEPTWDELRGLSAEERRLVIEYFRRLNAKKQ